MGDIIGAAGKYGGLAGVILALAGVVLLAVIRKKEAFDPKVFKLVVGSLVFLALLSLIVLFSSLTGERPPTETHNAIRPKPVKPEPQRDVEPPKKDKPSRPSSIHVSGSVIPVPAVPAIVTIVGKPGRWPIDATGSFDFRVQGTPGEQGRVRILEGTKVVYDGYQDLSRRFSVRISE